MSYPLIKLGQVLQESKILSTIPNPYRRIRVRLNTEGVVQRPIGNDKEGATKYFIRKAGQFIYGKQNLHKGAFGIVPQILDGFESSADIPSFDVDSKWCLPEWIYYFFKSGNQYKKLETLARGVGSKRIHASQLFEIEIPLPSIKEQKNLIAQAIQKEKIIIRLGEKFTHQTTLITKLKQQILQDAVQGKLVPQVPNDEPASVLLEKISTEKEKLIKEGKIKKSRLDNPIKTEEVPFEIPSGWVWCRLGDLCLQVDYGTSQKASTNKIGVPVLRMNNVNDLKIIYENIKYVLLSEEEQNKLKLRKGDILFNRTNSFELVGKTAVFHFEEMMTFASYLIRVRTTGLTNSDYINCYINSLICRKTQLEPNIIQQNGQANFNGTKLQNILIPLPPLQEQKRIVEKVKVLFERIEKLANESALQKKLLNQLDFATVRF